MLVRGLTPSLLNPPFWVFLFYSGGAGLLSNLKWTCVLHMMNDQLAPRDIAASGDVCIISDPSSTASPQAIMWSLIALTAFISAMCICLAQWSLSANMLSLTEPHPSADPSSPAWCHYGTLPGTWVSDATASATGLHWQLFEPRCQLRDLLSAYAGSHASMEQDSSEPQDLDVFDGEKVESTLPGDPGEAAAGGLSPQSPGRVASILFIGDSVDRHILQYLCQHVGGTVRAIILRDSLFDSGDPCGSAPSSSPRALRQPSPSDSAHQLSAANMSGCVINTCSSPSGSLRLLATYIPGVHPSGPFHKGRRLNYKARIDQGVTVWRSYSAYPPDLVVVSSMLWDVARMSAFEPALLAGPELPLEVLQSWMLNYTDCVQYAQRAVPAARGFVFHTTMLPRHNPETGEMEKSYLGRAAFIRQLNAAGRQVAAELGMEVVEHEAVGSRFLEGQSYLKDLIHPGLDVGLELGNIYLNLVEQAKGSDTGDRAQ